MDTHSMPKGFLRLPQVLALIPVCKSSWWNGCKSGRYPKPVKIGPNSTAWRAEDIAELMQRLANPENRPEGQQSAAAK
jgi:predicted DNA-binding transcriptional regulator AlpA